MLLGGYTAVMDQGEVLQYGPTADVFRHPKSMRVARAFSDPPMNLLAATRSATGLILPGGMVLDLRLPDAAAAQLTGEMTLGTARRRTAPAADAPAI